MNVNKERLKELISGVITYCDSCPIHEEGDWEACDKYRQKMDEDTHLKSCEEALLDWLQEFDIAEALEEGAHIVNGVAIFPPEEIPSQPDYGTPCEKRGKKGKPSAECDFCPVMFECPYGWGD